MIQRYRRHKALSDAESGIFFVLGKIRLSVPPDTLLRTAVGVIDDIYAEHAKSKAIGAISR